MYEDDFEEEPLIESVGVNLEEFAIALAIVQNLVVATLLWSRPRN